MIRILITGADSYIGKSFENWLLKENAKYFIHTIDMKNEEWENYSFSSYDVVFHVAGIAHVPSNNKLDDLYYKVNRDLTIKTAKKAKSDGVRQFIFMSSIIVYGDSGLGIKTIDVSTLANPSNAYGKSKLQAEEGIKLLEDVSFKIVILRPPMIYGKGSKGNYPKLANAARHLPIFPDIYNQRSMLHIDNLCEFIKLVIDNIESGIFFPQNAEYVCTSEMVEFIAEIHGKKIKLIKIFNRLIKFMGRYIGSINKMFGNLVYEKSMSDYKINYRIRNFRETIELTER